MKVVFLLLAVISSSLARPKPQGYILQQFFDKLGFGGFSFGYQSSDGTKREETGEIKNPGTDDEALSVKGSYSYVGDDGKTYEVKYEADENGFQPEGEHLPPSAGVKKLGLPGACVASLCGDCEIRELIETEQEWYKRVKKQISYARKQILVLNLIFAVVLARPQNPFSHITRYFFDFPDPGTYSFGYDTSDGTRHDQTGELRNVGTENEALVMRGSYSYIGPDGMTYTVNYIADENGFRPEGEHLPPSAGVKKLGIMSACIASLCGGN